MKRLTLGDAVICGVCSGIANYFNIDPVFIRIAFVLMCFLGFGSPIILYLILWIILEMSD